MPGVLRIPTYPDEHILMTQVSRPAKKSRPLGFFRQDTIAHSVAALLLVLVVTYGVVGLGAKKAKGIETLHSKGIAAIQSGEIDSIPYYHCDGNGSHLVLLHGSRFTKEDWKTSGIMDIFCEVTDLSVSAIDLPVSKDHEDLQKLLISMENANFLARPVTLVTPSASGKTMTDWIDHGNISEIQNFISTWIPVAAGSVGTLDDANLDTLKKDSSISILAIYGSRDAMGARVSTKLEEQAGASKLEIEGGHPCYLDSPKDFTDAVLRQLGIGEGT